MNDIKMTESSEIVYLGDELIVRNAFTVGIESYDIVVKSSEIGRLRDQEIGEDVVVQKVKEIWEKANKLLPKRDVEAVFVWDRNRTIVPGISIESKCLLNVQMRQLHNLVSGLVYVGIPSQSMSIQAQSSTSNTTTPSVSIGLPPEPPSPKPKASKNPISPRSMPNPTPCSERRLTLQRPPVQLTDEIELVFVLTMTEFTTQIIRDRDSFLSSLVEPLKVLKRTGGIRNNEALRFIKLFAAKIADTLSQNQKQLANLLAVKYLCTYAAQYVQDAGQTDSELLLVLNQSSTY